MGKFVNSVLRNTAANYILLAWRMITAIFLVRILFLGLGKADYGFWSLLWAVFGYSLLLDFGFGQSVQKYTAEAESDGDIERFNRLINTIIISYLLMCTAIIAATLAVSPFIDRIFELNATPEIVQYFKTVFMVFGIGTALVFPTGVFPEILAGLRLVHIKNAALFFNVTIQIAGIYLILKLGYSLLTLAIFASLLNIFTNFIMAWFVFRRIPGFKLSPRYFKFGNICEIASFSAFAYLLNFARMIIFKTDKLVLGIMLGMPSVAIYQLGTRISEITEKLTTQFQETLGPVAASVYKSGDMEKLKWIMLKSNRLTAFITTGAFVVLFIPARQILFVWLKLEGGEAAVITHIMMVAVYLNVMFRSSSEKFLLMAGRHKALSFITLAESIANIILSIILVTMLGVTGVAWGTLIPGAIVAVLIIFPLAAHFSRIPLWLYFRMVYLPLLLVIILPVAAGLAAVYYFPLKQWNVIYLGCCFAITGGLYAICGFYGYLSREERGTILSKIPFTRLRSMFSSR